MSKDKQEKQADSGAAGIGSTTMKAPEVKVNINLALKPKTDNDKDNGFPAIGLSRNKSSIEDVKKTEIKPASLFA